MKRLLSIAGAMSALLSCLYVPATAADALGANDTAAVRAHMARLSNVDRMGGKTCSATLIASDAALTATSCIDDVPTHSLRVFFGFHAAEWLLLRDVKAAIPVPGHGGLSLLRLGGAGRKYIEWSDGAAWTDLPLFVAGYRSPRSHVLTIGECAVDGGASVREADPACVLGADSVGNGVFRREHGKLRIEGVIGDGDDLSSFYRLHGAELDLQCAAG